MTDQLGAGMKAELAVQQDPERMEALVSDLTRAKAHADELKQRSARWQITLNDGAADLQSDIDYDLRDRLRTISREAEQLIDDADPEEIWEQFSEWFHQQISAAASANFVWAAERAGWLAGQVAEHFAEGADVALPELRFDDQGIAGKVDGARAARGGEVRGRAEAAHRYARRLQRHADVRHARHVRGPADLRRRTGRHRARHQVGARRGQAACWTAAGPTRRSASASTSTR